MSEIKHYEIYMNKESDPILLLNFSVFCTFEFPLILCY